MFLVRYRKGYFTDSKDKKKYGNIACGIFYTSSETVLGDVFDLFWLIDEQLNPYETEFRRLPNFSMFFKYSNRDKGKPTCPKLPFLQNKKEKDFDTRSEEMTLSYLREQKLREHFDCFGERTNMFFQDVSNVKWEDFTKYKGIINFYNFEGRGAV